ncbi:DMSO/TMAO reductase YedYZ molybdopterin-dependent catalytic subunit [Murinocardiopsis flavida]|uniref:DMSO/TMAO reductase YedYZ molybdopterin-dependent catalytic subunit n=1 Tax=Murinocardiopsis flavida TaxID=645275 RepID=A0A2P8D9A1_9ACTN|nr:molybdopterin-dependent oxidoreductase [Murinocardiopsis flavida]PSK93782.1 DMSO/TMAO reductase YedYZ molybdopterin-dependent catalytic subunit [Murinocardiopsis flavida]
MAEKSASGYAPGALGRGAAVGLLTAGVALAAAELTAGVLGAPQSSPVVVVGDAVVRFSPQSLKEFAIAAFGVYDKAVLIGGIVAVLAVCAVALGAASLRRPGLAQGAMAVFAAIGVAAVFLRPDFAPLSLLPPLLGAAAGALVVGPLARRAAAASAPPAAGEAPEPAAAAAGEESGSAAAGPAPEPAAMEEAPDPTAASATARRGFLLAGAGTAVAALAGGGIGRLLLARADVGAQRATVRLPAPAKPLPPLPKGVDLPIRGISPFSTPTARFYRIDTALTVPQLAPDEWRLRVHGLVDRPVELDFAELLKRPLVEADVTLACVSNEVGGDLVGNTRWLGVRLAEVLRAAGVQRGADQLLSSSADGWTCGTPVEAVLDGRDALLAVAMDGDPLTPEHGFPVRMVVPGLYGYVSATKWVTDIKVTRFADERSYWADRGWAVEAPIKTMSRIDVPTSRAAVAAGTVAVAGVAWAQRRGIEAVQARVDSGEWRDAELAEVPGIDTWRQWTWEWDAEPGPHTLQVRAVDTSGRPQTGAAADPIPNGASGWHTVRVEVE